MLLVSWSTSTAFHQWHAFIMAFDPSIHPGRLHFHPPRNNIQSLLYGPGRAKLNTLNFTDQLLASTAERRSGRHSRIHFRYPSAPTLSEADKVCWFTYVDGHKSTCCHHWQHQMIALAIFECLCRCHPAASKSQIASIPISKDLGQFSIRRIGFFTSFVVGKSPFTSRQLGGQWATPCTSTSFVKQALWSRATLY